MPYRTIQLRYINESLQIGMAGLKEVYLLSPKLTQLQPEVYRGKLVYRAKGSSRRIPYSKLKQGLKRCSIQHREEIPSWLYGSCMSGANICCRGGAFPWGKRKS